MALLCGATAALAADGVVIAPAEGGAVVVDNFNPLPGDVVTITVTPDADYTIEKADITVEATVDPGLAHAPAVGAPSVGCFLPLEGEQPSNTSLEAQYTFVMPEQPLNVLVTANFTRQHPTGLNDVSTSRSVSSVRYVDLSGHVSCAPQTGINLVVTTYADGSHSVTRVLK